MKRVLVVAAAGAGVVSLVGVERSVSLFGAATLGAMVVVVLAAWVVLAGLLLLGKGWLE